MRGMGAAGVLKVRCFYANRNIGTCRRSEKPTASSAILNKSPPTLTPKVDQTAPRWRGPSAEPRFCPGNGPSSTTRRNTYAPPLQYVDLPGGGRNNAMRRSLGTPTWGMVDAIARQTSPSRRCFDDRACPGLRWRPIGIPLPTRNQPGTLGADPFGTMKPGFRSGLERVKRPEEKEKTRWLGAGEKLCFWKSCKRHAP